MLNSKSIDESCNQAYAKLPYQQTDFLETKVGFYTPIVSLFPSAVDNETSQKIFAFEHGITEEDCRMMRIKSNSFGKLAYILPEEPATWSSQKFKAPELFSSRELYVDFIMQSISKDVLLLIVQDEAIELIIKSNGELQFHNHFKVNTTEDILYYTLYTLEQLGINKDDIHSFIGGNLSSAEFDIDEIRRFINIETVQQKEDFGSPKELNLTYFSSFQLLLCE